MKKLLYFAFAAMLCCGFAACSDDDEGIGNPADIIGKWTGVKHVINWGGETDTEEYYPGEVVFVFNEDGTYSEYEDGTLLATLSYRISGNQLILTDGEENMQVTIMSLTPSELVLFVAGYDEEEGHVQMTMYFERYE